MRKNYGVNLESSGFQRCMDTIYISTEDGFLLEVEPFKKNDSEIYQCDMYICTKDDSKKRRLLVCQSPESGQISDRYVIEWSKHQLSDFDVYKENWKKKYE